jgi:hypothetical protein
VRVLRRARPAHGAARWPVICVRMVLTCRAAGLPLRAIQTTWHWSRSLAGAGSSPDSRKPSEVLAASVSTSICLHHFHLSPHPSIYLSIYVSDYLHTHTHTHAHTHTHTCTHIGTGVVSVSTTSACSRRVLLSLLPGLRQVPKPKPKTKPKPKPNLSLQPAHALGAYCCRYCPASDRCPNPKP